MKVGTFIEAQAVRKGSKQNTYAKVRHPFIEFSSAPRTCLHCKAINANSACKQPGHRYGAAWGA